MEEGGGGGEVCNHILGSSKFVYVCMYICYLPIAWTNRPKFSGVAHRTTGPVWGECG